MKKFLFLLIAVSTYQLASAQFVARMEVKEPIPGVCDNKNVYVLLPMLGGDQKEAICPVTDEAIQKRLNAEVSFLKDSVAYTDKGIVNLIINCKGELVRCEIDNKTRHAELDKQIVAVFNSLGEWKPGKLNGKKVDSSRLWSFDIVNGKITVK